MHLGRGGCVCGGVSRLLLDLCEEEVFVGSVVLVLADDGEPRVGAEAREG
jgi:hypothetical protein